LEESAAKDEELAELKSDLTATDGPSLPEFQKEVYLRCQLTQLILDGALER